MFASVPFAIPVEIPAFVKAPEPPASKLGPMQFSSLHDPIDVARAQGALDAAWVEIQSRDLTGLGSVEAERKRLSRIVSSLLLAVASDRELVTRIVSKFVAVHGEEMRR